MKTDSERFIFVPEAALPLHQIDKKLPTPAGTHQDSRP